ncbi:lipopolysaccharide assembly protein LapA domain-containing protein [Gammaproteobacteria bacterium]|nr:lipopolysaccharide assembly protein LapA domain-containing protein [Gammaproteobacteria bacterium]
MKRIIYFIIFVIVLVLAISFAVNNPKDVEVVYYFNFKWTGSLSVLLFCVLALGALLGTLLTSSWVWKAKRQRAVATREMKRMEQEISNLRSLPAKE